MREGWGQRYVTESYRLWFDAGLDAGDVPNIAASLRHAGQDPDAALARARSEEVAAALAADTDRAMAAGIFGSPSFMVGGELFWATTGSRTRWRGTGTAASTKPRRRTAKLIYVNSAPAPTCNIHGRSRPGQSPRVARKTGRVGLLINAGVRIPVGGMAATALKRADFRRRRRGRRAISGPAARNRSRPPGRS